jgi:hypothetical protein
MDDESPKFIASAGHFRALRLVKPIEVISIESSRDE